MQLRSRVGIGVVLLCCTAGWGARAGGSGLNTVVVINQSSPNSCELGNYYCERRQVPPENVLHISWPGTNTLWSSNEFQVNLLTPLLNMLAARQLTNQVYYVVLSMDIPFQTSNGATVNGTTSALFYGLKPDALGTKGVVNSYAASEQVFAQAKPGTAPGYSFLATMITGDSLAQAKQLVDQGVAGDGTFPTQPVVLAKSSDLARNIRYTAFDNAIFNVKLRGVSSILRTNADSLWDGTSFLGYETGLATFTVPAGAFVPGAVADSLTSYGGIIFGPNSQTTLLAMINAGATGSYGTVAEPSADPQKFPDPQVYFYQCRGFTLAEGYYQSLNVPYLGLVVAEPLSAPFAQPGTGRWSTTNTPLSGTAPLSVRFSAPAGRTLQQIDLFVDGKYFDTLTNATPRAGNVLNVTFNGYPISYVVPANASLGSVAAGLAAALNAPTVTNTTRIVAYPHGDRVELQSLSSDRWAAPFYFSDTAGGASNSSYRVTYLPDTFPPRLTAQGRDGNSVFQLHVDIATTLPYVILASGNLTDWLPVYTNLAGGLLDFADADAANYPRRFYRVVESVPGPRPRLTLGADTNGDQLNLHVDSLSSLPYAIQVSTNLGDWTPVYTNQLGGAADFADPITAGTAPRFYRTWNIPPAAPAFAVVDSPAGNALVRVDSAARPYVVEVSTKQDQWAGLATNYVLHGMQTAAGSSIGGADALTTFLSVSTPSFLDSEAFGRRQYLVGKSSLLPNDYIQFSFTKTNGTVVTVGLTNHTAGENSTNLVKQLYDLINATASLQGPDGVVAEDFNIAGSIFLTLRARSAGWPAAGIQVAATASNVIVVPSSPLSLTQNLSDLLPRNHLYLTAGATRLGVDFNLETGILPDGYHELTAVAYEGSHTRTQTRVTLPVVVQNTSLEAAITLLDLTDTVPVEGTYHIRVAANTTNDISSITLYSTGGILATATNEYAATFQFTGTSLGAGLHPFYALVQPLTGVGYRTETHWARFTRTITR